MAIYTLRVYGLDCFASAASGSGLGEFGEAGADALLDRGDRFTFDAASGTAYDIRINDTNALWGESLNQTLDSAVTLTSPSAVADENRLEAQPSGGRVFPVGAETAVIYQITFRDIVSNQTYRMAGVTLDVERDVRGIPALEYTDGVYWVGDVPPDGATLEVTAKWNGDGHTGDAGQADIGPVPLICFAPGSLIATPDGSVPVEALRPGDHVLTGDGSARPVRWAGCSRDPAGFGPGRAVRIRAGALGPGLPARDLTVSRQHRIMVDSPALRRMFGLRRALVPAHALTALAGVEMPRPDGPIAWHHLLLDTHDVVLANGLPCESLWLGEMAFASLPPASRRRIAALGGVFLLRHLAAGPALPFPGAAQARALALRHVGNGRPLVAPRRAPVGRCVA
jgi:hypothetical protein